MAGCTVENGRLCNKSTTADTSSGGYVFRVVRNGEIILNETTGASHLKHFKETVHEVSVQYHMSFVLCV